MQNVFDNLLQMGVYSIPRVPSASNARKEDTFSKDNVKKSMIYVILLTLLRTSAWHVIQGIV